MASARPINCHCGPSEAQRVFILTSLKFVFTDTPAYWFYAFEPCLCLLAAML